VPIKFSGDFEVQRTPEEVYAFLTDPHRFAPLLPDYRGVTVEDPEHFTVQVSVGISHIRGTANVKMHLQEATPPRHAQYKGQGSVAGGNVSVIATFDLNAVGGGTKVAWQGEAQIFGRLTSVGAGVLEPLGRKQVQKLVNGLQTALQNGAASTSPGAVTGNTASANVVPPDVEATKENAVQAETSRPTSPSPSERDSGSTA
jgi:carbon monoxide dehydrogenase subunit G